MSGRDWFMACVLAAGVLWCVEMWYCRLERVLVAKLKLDESQADALDRICGRLEVIGNELAESNANYADECDEWTTTDDDSDGEWKLN